MCIHVKMPRIKNFNIIGEKKKKNLQRHTVIQPWRFWGGKLRRAGRFRPQDTTALYHAAFLATEPSAGARVFARSRRRCVFLRVFSALLTFPQNAADISRGFEDLIPSVFEELCAALLGNTERKTAAAAEPPACPAFWGPSLHGIRGQARSLSPEV